MLNSWSTSWAQGGCLPTSITYLFKEEAPIQARLELTRLCKVEGSNHEYERPDQARADRSKSHPRLPDLL